MTAKEMFEKLGYEQHESRYEIIYNMGNLKYIDDYRYISFNKENKTIEVGDNSTGEFYLQLEELKAINKQIEELRWDNE